MNQNNHLQQMKHPKNRKLEKQINLTDNQTFYILMEVAVMMKLLFQWHPNFPKKKNQ